MINIWPDAKLLAKSFDELSKTGLLVVLPREDNRTFIGKA
jgi:hypothetical protein